MIICHPEIQKEITATMVIGGYNTSVIKCVYQIWGGSEKVLPWSISQNQYLNDQKFWFFEVEQTKNFSVLCTWWTHLWTLKYGGLIVFTLPKVRKKKDFWRMSKGFEMFCNWKQTHEGTQKKKSCVEKRVHASIMLTNIWGEEILNCYSNQTWGNSTKTKYVQILSSDIFLLHNIREK